MFLRFTSCSNVVFHRKIVKAVEGNPSVALSIFVFIISCDEVLVVVVVIADVISGFRWLFLVTVLGFCTDYIS
jgi:hypothetical protein